MVKHRAELGMRKMKGGIGKWENGRWRTIDVVGRLKLIYNNQYSIILGLAAINYDKLNIDCGLIL